MLGCLQARYEEIVKARVAAAEADMAALQPGDLDELTKGGQPARLVEIVMLHVKYGSASFHGAFEMAQYQLAAHRGDAAAAVGNILRSKIWATLRI